MESTDPFLKCIGESDIPFEMQLLKDRQNEEIWNQYIEHKHQQVRGQETSLYLKESYLAILYRRYREFKNNYEYWQQFIDYYLTMVGQNYSDSEIDKVIQIFTQSINEFGSKLPFWLKFFRFMVAYKETIKIEFILDIFNVGLITLKQNEHLELWILLFNDILEKMEISSCLRFDVYSSFFIYLKNQTMFNILSTDDVDNTHSAIPTFDSLFTGLIHCMTTWDNIVKFDSIFREFMTPAILLKLSESELELYRKYLDKLIKLSTNNKSNETAKFDTKITSLFNEIVTKFPDQQSIFTIKYAKYLILTDKFDTAVDLLENKMNASVTIKDFTMIFDSFTEVLEKHVEKLSELANASVDENLLVKYLDKLESLLANRPILLNDVKLRQNNNSPSTWIERLKILEDNDKQNDDSDSMDKLLQCYSKAVLTIDTKKIPKDEKLLLPQIWCDYAKIYGSNDDMQTCRELFETATKVPWTELEQLEYIWIEWINLEVANNDIKHAVFICQKAISIPQQISTGKIDIDDENLSVHMKLFKSIRLWSLYLDLLENCEDFDNVCKGYEDAIELKVINGVLIINYCQYLEEKGYIEKSFSIFERGLGMFNGESRSILYCIYLNKILQYWDKLNWDIERVREVFEEGLEYYKDEEVFKRKNLKQVYILYSEWEKKYGSKIRSSKILREGIDNMKKQSDKLDLYKLLIVNTLENKGIEWVIEIFQDAVEKLSVCVPGYISDIICGFVEVEVAMGDISKARQVLRYGVENIMEFNKSREDRREIWDLFKAFELENGDETTYKEMLRLKRYLENIYGEIRDFEDVRDDGEDMQESKKSKNSQVRKELQDRIGFVASSDGPKTTTFTAAVEDGVEAGKSGAKSKNKDAIDLDLDLEMDM